ncbi:MAG: glutaredoxin family protein, partial [Thermostichales cyanobacterium SRBZ-1_bins_19]
MSDQGSIPSIVPPITWILYSKPGCHLCEGLLDKLRQLPEIAPTLTVRDITTNPQWWQRFHLDIPVLALQTPGDPEMVLP